MKPTSSISLFFKDLSIAHVLKKSREVTKTLSAIPIFFIHTEKLRPKIGAIRRLQLKLINSKLLILLKSTAEYAAGSNACGNMSSIVKHSAQEPTEVTLVTVGILDFRPRKMSSILTTALIFRQLLLCLVTYLNA